MFGFIKKIFGSSQDRHVKRFKRLVADVNRWDERFQSLTDEELRGKTDEFKQRYQQGESLDQLLPEAYGTVKNVCRRLLGTEVHVSGYDQKWDMVPYDVQIVGAIALHNGFISEMQTGEGKTLTATMPLYLNALAGKPVHLVTVNDYLCSRDCQWVGSILRWLGLKTAVLTNATPPEKRPEIYQADVVYGTASEFGFDYLRDNSMAMRKEDQVQRGHFFSIIDEIDSILIDEARTPLIISGPTPQSMQMYDQLKGDAAKLVKMQRALCSKLSSDAQKALGKWLTEESLPTDKKELEKVKNACKQLWLVGKGNPKNKTLRRARENPDLRNEIDKWDVYFHSDQTKEEKAEVIAELMMVVDERGNEFELTDKGIAAWAEMTGEESDDFVMLDLGHEYAKIDSNNDLTDDEKFNKKLAVSEEDVHRKERAHNLRQLLRAHLLMEKDVDYMVDQDKIVIVDENTGRPQPGRRFSDGLHQAIEAKEDVKIQKETQTYASITLQNYFRMYEKLAGMTGTAITEANEFKEIYKLDVLQIPTYKPCKRTDAHDEIYMTEREKYQAILKGISEVHEKGRPILIGTESVDVSEKLSRILKQKQIPHSVLNAKNHAQEAEIIAQAGAHGAVTVATNMAGRGTDIKLQEDVAQLGGLHVVGTTRHQSRRTDRQLRGRSARLGDPGSSIFYISFEDPLMRLFASPRLNTLIQKFRPPEGEPISASILNRSIQTAQKRVESRNYTMRKHTLEYDDVMNKQRQEIYSFRNEILRCEDVVPHAHQLLENVLLAKAGEFFVSKGEEGGWDAEGFREWLMSSFPVNFDEGIFDDDLLTVEQIEETAVKKILDAFDQKFHHEMEKAAELGPQYDPKLVAQDAIRSVIVHKIDELWQEHLLVMDYLRSEVSLRAVAQRDPLLEFKHEAFILFDALSTQLQTEAARNVFKVEIASPKQNLFQEMLAEVNLESNRLIFDEPPPEKEIEQVEKKPPVSFSSDPKIGRNDPCPCKSGKKYKKCCGATYETT
ncbi:MAG: Protein translocase subunit SecA [Chlamydiales bacterium]|nr:Protein translocase subunit SecA [Chlamydiales bacterium]MCH9619642.1 Protein translocase subunit SecA [Chlamydiales bacterium]MCH9623248.1 Protein translocase subunit SecA [Chlamydiales bacterium]